MCSALAYFVYRAQHRTSGAAEKLFVCSFRLIAFVDLHAATKPFFKQTLRFHKSDIGESDRLRFARRISYEALLIKTIERAPVVAFSDSLAIVQAKQK